MTTAEQLYEEALRLPPRERERLAQRLQGSLEKEPGYDEAWTQEFDRRLSDLRTGKAIPIELDDRLDIFGDDD
ncbi:MAG: addiction module protein [Dehalococcoidia bacterium]